MKSVFSRFRVEDLLAATFALALIAYGGFRAALAGLELGESDYWDFAFILAPLGVLVFSASVRYAIHGGEAALKNTGIEVRRSFRDWLPFLFFLMFYEAFRTRIWKLILTEDLDAQLLAIDRRLFGETPAVWMDRMVQPLLTDLLTLAYFLHLVLPPVVAFALYRRHVRVFREFLLAILLAGMMGSIGYMLVPAVGPAVAYPELFQNTLSGLLYAPVTALMDAARAPRDVFPSLHVGVSAIVLWFSARIGRRWFWVLLPLVLANWWSTIYLRYHYLIDVFAGWLVAGAAIWLAGVLLRLESRLRGDRGP